MTIELASRGIRSKVGVETTADAQLMELHGEGQASRCAGKMCSGHTMYG